MVNSFTKRVNSFLGKNNVGSDHIRALHKLNYLPIEIKALPEGTICPIRVPILTIINTIPEFFWITNYLETLMSTILWLPMTSATTARVYRKELKKHAEKTGFSNEMLGFLCHDFSIRGMAGLEAAIMSGIGHLTSFIGSETIPAIEACEEYYNANAEKEMIAMTIPASEHSVMCAGGVEDELGTFKRFTQIIYPDGYVSIVSDTWDFWKVMTEYLPQMKEEILARDGRLVIRPDSGIPEDIICGVPTSIEYDYDLEDLYSKELPIEEALKNSKDWDFTLINNDDAEDWGIAYTYLDIPDNITVKIKDGNNIYHICFSVKFDSNECGNYGYIDKNYNFYIKKIETCNPILEKGAYEILWDIFGGTINKKGYKVLNPKIGIIYGDSINLDRQKEIYRHLEKKGFAATNLVLGIGSYTYQYKTRDSLGFAMKATWCQINGEGKEIFKDPKTDDGMKKSLKGLIRIDTNEAGIYYATDCVNKDKEQGGCLKTIFKDGKLIKEFTLNEIRETLYKQ